MTYQSGHAETGPARAWPEQILSIASEMGMSSLAELGPTDDSSGAGVLHVCLDTLGRIMIPEIAGFIARLSRLPAGATLALAIDLGFAPSAEVPRALLPFQTWRRLLRSAGLEIVSERPSHFPKRRADVPYAWLSKYWSEANLFGFENGAAEEIIIVCRRDGTVIDAEAVSDAVDTLLDASYIKRKKEKFGYLTDRKIAINIHQIQDYLNIRPILDLLDPALVLPLLRESPEFRPLKRLAVLSDLRRNGFVPRLYERLEDLDWSELSGCPLISASESSITPGHALSRHLVEAAKITGSPTFLLQHGIWSESFPTGPVSFGSQRVLAWGQEHALGFSPVEQAKIGLSMPHGATPQDRFNAIGSPKFADSLPPGGRESLGARLGVRDTDFLSVTLVGTNLHWRRHGDTREFRKNLTELTRRNPEQLFIVKLHPAENFYEYEMLRDHNVVIYDDVLALATGYHTSRLLHGVDRVISSLSSLLIDASILGLPVFQYDTGNTLRYEGIDPISGDTLADVFTADGEAAGRAAASLLSAHYAEADHALFYEKLASEISTAHVEPEAKQGALEQIGSYGLIESLLIRSYSRDLKIDDVEVLTESGLFDPEYYSSIAVDLEELTPIEHFLTRGGWRGLNPRASFDSFWYGQQHPEITSEPILPVMHYIRKGCDAGYSPHILFCDSWYRAQTGASWSGLTALGHYLLIGESAGTSCHPLFEPAFYARFLADPRQGSLLEDFLGRHGAAISDPSPGFSIAEYLRNSPDIAGANVNPLIHYLLAGVREGRHRSDLQRMA